MFHNITEAQGFGVMGAAFAFLVAFMSDAYLTMTGLAKGQVEGNPVSAWLFKKIGQSLTVFLEAVAVCWTGAFLTDYGAGPAALFFGILAVGEGIVAVRNYLKLKAAKIL